MNDLINKIKPVLYLLIAIWAVFALNLIFAFGLNQYGIIPRSITGLRGILFSPFLHANLSHIVSNSFPFLVLGSLVFYFYSDKALRILVYSILLSGILVWIFARPAVHIGISGVIYALATFLIFAGFFRKDFISFIISIAVIFIYGGLVWGIFPNNFYVSWEGHISGAIAGYFLAHLYFRKNKNII